MFNILNPNMSQSTDLTGKYHQFSDVKSRIENLLKDNKIILFMKGNTSAPQCGFSANSSAILSKHNKPFATYNILQDQELREAIKVFSNWPTFPQLYVGGQLVGGNDIIVELEQNGELKQILD